MLWKGRQNEKEIHCTTYVLYLCYWVFDRMVMSYLLYGEGDRMKYWFISYFAAGYGGGPNREQGVYANTVIDMSPARWVKDCIERKYTDLPYVILYAEEISEELYTWYYDNV